MANSTQSYSETFSNENSNDSGYWSDYQEAPKIYGILMIKQCGEQLTKFLN